MGEVATMPLYWDVDVVLARDRVTGILQNATSIKTWNIATWEVKG